MPFLPDNLPFPPEILSYKIANSTQTNNKILMTEVFLPLDHFFKLVNSETEFISNSLLVLQNEHISENILRKKMLFSTKTRLNKKNQSSLSISTLDTWLMQQ